VSVREGRLVAALWLAVMLLPSPGARAQNAEPLRKTDLIRLLTGGALSNREIADLVRRDCVSFTPTARDRQDLEALGADSVILGRIDACVHPTPARPPARPIAARRRPAAAAPPPPPRPVLAPREPEVHTAQPSPTPRPILLLPPLTASAARTGFVSGTGQRGVVGQPAPLPLVFEVRDSNGTALVGVAVALAVTNGRLLPAGGGAQTDSLGQIHAEVVLGMQAAPTVVTAAVGAIVRQATLYPSPGTAARLVATYNGQSVDRQLVLEPDAPAYLTVRVQDAFGNRVTSPGVVVAVADDGILNVTRVTQDSLGALVTLRPGRPGGGSTSLALQAGRVRLDLSASVRRRP
jgi:hypothetical protein